MIVALSCLCSHVHCLEFRIAYRFSILFYKYIYFCDLSILSCEYHKFRQYFNLYKVIPCMTSYHVQSLGLLEVISTIAVELLVGFCKQKCMRGGGMLFIYIYTQEVNSLSEEFLKFVL